MKPSKWCSFFRNKHNTHTPEWLRPDYKVEVYQYDLNGTYSAYEMVVHDIGTDTIRVFYHDDSKAILYTVSKMFIAPITYRIKDAIYSVGEHIEVYYRVDDESPWGWWSAVITAIDEDMYLVTYPGGEEEIESRMNTRKAVFN